MIRVRQYSETAVIKVRQLSETAVIRVRQLSETAVIKVRQLSETAVNRVRQLSETAVIRVRQYGETAVIRVRQHTASDAILPADGSFGSFDIDLVVQLYKSGPIVAPLCRLHAHSTTIQSVFLLGHPELLHV